MRGSLVMKTFLLALVVSILMGMRLEPATAQEHYVSLHGRVQWIAAQKMMLLAEASGLPVTVDLIQVPLEQYAVLTQGNWVAVDGIVSYDGRRVIATSVMPAVEIRGGR
jgi:hypothetical protein